MPLLSDVDRCGDRSAVRRRGLIGAPETLEQMAPYRVGHLRTRNGDHEVGLVVEGIEGQVVGIEIKLAANVNDADLRHLHWLRNQLPNDTVDLLVVTTGTHAYRRPDGVAVVPLALLGE